MYYKDFSTRFDQYAYFKYTSQKAFVTKQKYRLRQKHSLYFLLLYQFMPEKRSNVATSLCHALVLYSWKRLLARKRWRIMLMSSCVSCRVLR